MSLETFIIGRTRLIGLVFGDWFAVAALGSRGPMS